MPQNRTTKQARAYGQGCTVVWGGCCPYGSTVGGSAPVIPNVEIDPTFGVQPKWSKFTVQHDGAEVGKLQFLLDSDTYDLHVLPVVQANRRQTPATLFFPSTTAGSGLQITAVGAGSGATQTIPVTEVVIASGAGAGLATVAISGNVITLTVSSTTTNATTAAAINAATGTLGVTAATVGTATDLTYVAAITQVLTGGQNSDDPAYASLTLPTAGAAGINMVYTANQAGAAGNEINILYVSGGTTTASAALTAPNEITLTIGTTATVNTLLTAINVTALATVGGLITASYTATANTEAALHTALGTAAAASSTQNITSGTNLSGGEILKVCIDGKINPAALGDNGLGISNYDSSSLEQQILFPHTLPYSHFSLRTYLNDVAVDLNAQTQLFVPSVTQGYGVMFNSIATVATAASATIYSNPPTNTHGNIFTALQPGDAGNKISITQLNPQATLFIPSTTGGDGLLFQAATAYAGQAGQQISVTMATPNASATVARVVVTGLNIAIFPQSGAVGGADTNGTISTAVAANPAAAALVGTPTATGSSDLVTGNFSSPLGGGYSLSSSATNVSVTGDPTNGFSVVLSWGSAVTNAGAKTAILAACGPTSALPLLNVTALSTTTDVLVPTGATFLTGGVDTSDIQVLYSYPQGGGVNGAASGGLYTNVTVAATLDGSGDLATLTVASTANFPSVGSLDVVDTAGAVETLAYTAKTSTTFTTLSGGTAAHVLAVGALVYADAPVAVVSGELCTVYLGYTAANNTNAAIAAAVNSAVGNGLLTAVPVNSTTDLNPQLTGGILAWGLTGLPAAKGLQCLNQVRFCLFAIDNVSGGA